MTQQAAAISSQAWAPELTQRRIAMLESFSLRAMINAKILADQLAEIHALLNLAKHADFSRNRLVGIFEELSIMIGQAHAGAELDCQCMNYAYALAPDKADEFYEMMGCNQAHEFQH